ncbi:MAG: GAF domain-containing protein [Halobacteriaceae archaeon]
MTAPVVLLVDPDTEARRRARDELAAALEDGEHRIEAVGALDAAKSVVADETVDCVVTEYDLPDGTGLDLLEHVRTVEPDAGCILFTEAPPDDVDTAAVRESVTEYLDRGTPHALDRLGQLVYATVTRRAQASYPVPQDEDARRRALRAYDLDVAPLREALERVTGLAAEHFDVSLASVNVIEDHEQEYLVCHGLEEPWETVDREESICTFTIVEESGVMAVEDVQADPRFENVDDLHDYGFRSYMGATLRTAAGLPIGTLCVYGEAPRTFTEDEKSYLRTLAAVAMDLIEAYNGDGPTATEGDP